MAEAPSAKRWRSTLLGILGIAVGMPLVFYLKFGRIDGYAIAVTAFFVLLALAVELFSGSWTSTVPPSMVARSRWDALGVVWLLSIPFAPFFTWALTSFFDVNEGSYRGLLGTRALLSVVLPVVCALPLLRYVLRGAIAVMLAVLCVGTAFPVITGLGSAYDVLVGPRWETVTIVAMHDVDFRTGAGTRVHNRNVYAELADGRTLTHATGIELHTGSARLLVLRGIGRAIGVE